MRLSPIRIHSEIAFAFSSHNHSSKVWWGRLKEGRAFVSAGDTARAEAAHQSQNHSSRAGRGNQILEVSQGFLRGDGGRLRR